MANVEQTAQRDVEARSEAGFRRVDCDVHPIFGQAWEVALAPYMSREWRIRVGSDAVRSVDARRQNLGNFRLTLPQNMYWGNVPPLREDLMADGIPCTDSADAAAYLLDGCEIDRAILQPQGALGIGPMPNPDAAAVIAAATNDWLAENWLAADPRWRGTLVVAAQDPVRAAAEIRRHGDTPGFVAVQIPLGNTLLGHPIFTPVYEAAQEFSLPIVLHPGGADGQYPLAAPFAGGVPSYLLEAKANVTAIFAAEIASLIANGTFERYPQLKVVFTEVGYAWVPDLMWKMDAFWKTNREDTPWVRRLPSQYIVDHCRFTTQPFFEPREHKQIEQVFDMFDAEHTLMFATDYPHWNSEEPVLVEKLIPERIRERVLVGNALETFGERLL
jgi:uncharacterized protein